MADGDTGLTGDWSYPTQFRFGAGRIAELAEACAALGMKRPLLITDAGLAALPMVADAVKICEHAGLGVGVFSDVKPNPTGANVDAGVDAFRAGDHDGVIAFGGGSGLDAGKAVAFMIAQDRPAWDFEDVGDNWTRANTEGLAPVVAVPTTAGTGSETGRAVVLLCEETGTKKIIFHPKMMPGIIIADPELTLTLPPGITAATGMDALAHSFEAFAAPGFHPMADGIAVEALRLIEEWLPVAYGDGQDLAARAHMMAAASMGAVAFQKGLGAVHSLSHPVGALYDTHHGLTNAVFLPYVCVFNRAAIEGKMARLARSLALAEPTFDAVLDWLLRLRTELGIPPTAKDLGVEESRLAELAESAAKDPTAATNPVPVGPEEMLSIYRAAFDGRLE